jgi:hypothetical protein
MILTGYKINVSERGNEIAGYARQNAGIVDRRWVNQENSRLVPISWIVAGQMSG